MAASTLDPPIQMIRLSFLRRVLQMILLLGAASAAISVTGKFVGRTVILAGHTEDTRRYEIVVGNDVLMAPANAIRFRQARRDGVADRLDLYLRWPTMDGYTAATQDDFNNVGGSRTILFLSFEPQTMSRDMSGRYDPIYRFLVTPEERPGPAGLTIHQFKPSSGYGDEELAVSNRTTDGERFVARCLTGSAAQQSLAPCERDIQVGRGLSLTYRFPERLLAVWPALEQAARRAASGMLRGS